MSSSILIVEDEKDLVSTLEYNLEQDGYRVRSALTGQAGLEMATRGPGFDLMLLDLMLPDISGTEVCRQIRMLESTRTMPVIMMTARGDEVDRIVGFELGADDYVVKPFSVRELLLRIRAVLKRSKPVDEEIQMLTVGRLRVDVSGHRVWLENDEIVLTALEFRLLKTLLERRERVQTRERLLSDVWGIDADVTTRTVDTHVKRLRQKLGVAGQYIETLRGVGYRLRASPAEEAV